MKYFLFLLGFIFFSMLSCQKDENPLPNTQFQVDKTSIILEGIAGDFDSVLIKSNIGWTVTLEPSNASWVKLATINNSGSGNGFVVVTGIEKNLTNSPRVANIIITPSSNLLQPIQVKITQTPLTPHLIVDSTRIEYLETKILDSFQITTNMDWVIYGTPYWLSPSLNSGDGNQKILLTALKNDSSLYRTAKILVSPKDTSVLKAVQMEIKQGSPVLSVDNLNVLLGASINSADTVFVTENIEWNATTTSNWIKLKTIKVANQPDTLIVIANENNLNNTERKGTITINPIDANLSPSITLNVTQKSAPPALTWNKSFGGTSYDSCISIVKTSDGGYIMAGNSSSHDGDVPAITGTKGWVMKVDAFGSKKWSKTFGGSMANYFHCVSQTNDGGFVLAGYTYSYDDDAIGNHGGTEAWVVKIDANGNKLWSKIFGGEWYDFAYSITNSEDGGYVLAGFSSSKTGDISGSHGSMDGWVLKMDGQGNKLWSKSYGGSNEDYLNTVVKISSGYLLAGSSSSYNGDVSNQRGMGDGWLLKIDFSGNIITSKLFGGSEAELFNRIALTTDEGFVVSGASKSNDGNLNGNHGWVDAWVAKLNSNLNLEWSKLFGGEGHDEAVPIIVSADGSIFMGGYTESNDSDISGHHGGWSTDGWIMKLDPSGNKKWSKVYGGTMEDKIYSMVLSGDGGLIMAGYTHSIDGDLLNNHGQSDAWIIKIQP